MTKRVLLLTIFCFAAFCAIARQKAAPASQSAEEKAIRAEAAAWFKAKDGLQFSSYYAADATLLPPGGAAIAGKEKITAYWVSFFKQPGLVVSGGPASVEVAKSGEIAFDRGTFKLTVNDASGKPVTSTGKYVVVWKKQADGKWKAHTDIFNNDK